MNAPFRPDGPNVPAMLWPVWGFLPFEQRETVAVFFNYSDAVDYVTASSRNLYIGSPRYDERTEIVQLEARPNEDGSWSVAA